MKKAVAASAVVLVLGSCSAVLADLATEFSGFNSVSEIGVSGLKSSYHTPTKAGNTQPDFLFTLSNERVSYPHGVGQVPSPGGSIGKAFDEGVLGVKVQGGNLTVKVAGALNPQTGYYHSGWKTWYGQGDVFVTVADSAGIGHFALLNSWARDGSGALRSLDGGHYDQAQTFHVGREGYLVRLDANGDVVRVGGTGAYSPTYSPAPEGLDYRSYAQGGTDIGNAGLVHSNVADFGQTWYIQTWTVPLRWLSSDPAFDIGLHKTASCGNDQIGMVARVPAPGAAVLGLAGITTAFLKRRREFRLKS